VGEHRAAALDDIPTDRGLIVELAGRKVGLFKVGEEVHAILSVCPHQGGPVGRGGLFPTTRARVENRRLVEYLDRDAVVVCCPWHGWEFDIRTGVCTADRSRRVVRYPVEVRGSEVIVTMPDRPQNGGAGE
jgi:nitrite reductase/ring-hydroxylating ferredoxin subunit